MANKKSEAIVTFKAETQEFQNGINKANTTMGMLRSELRLNSAEMKNVGESTQKLKERQALLQQELSTNRNKIEHLNAKLEKAKQIYGENSNEVAKLKNQLNNVKVVEQNIQNEIGNTTQKIKENNQVMEKLSGAYDKAATASAAVVAGLVAIAGASVKAFSEVDEGADNIIKKTGATGEAAKELEEIYKEVAGTTIGTFDSTGNALGEINTRLGFTGDKLKTATEDFMNFARINDVDVVNAVQKVSRYMGDANIEADKYKEVLDELTKAGQASGIAVDTLAEMCTKYGAPMRALGFDTAESIAIFASWEQAGVNTEIAFSGMKKAISNWSAAGKDSRVEFKNMLEEIEKCPDIATATTKAIEVFGAKAGPDLADAIKGGRFEYEDMLKVVEDSAGTLDQTTSEITDELDVVEMMFKKVKVGASEFGAEILTELSPTISDFADNMDDYADKILDHKDEIIAGMKTIGAIAGTIFVTNKIAKTVESVNTIRKAIVALIPVRAAETAATVTQTTAQTALNASMLANPATWLIGSLALVGGAIYLASKKADEMTNSMRKMSDAEKEAKDNYDEFSKALDEANKAAEEKTDTSDRLIERLDKICTSSGKVKKGYEDEAEVIRTELADSYGIQAELIDGQFQNYKKLRKEIDKTIASKKAEIYLNENEGNYNDALNNKDEAFEGITSTSKAIEEQKKKIAQLEKEGEKYKDAPVSYEKSVYNANLKEAKDHLKELEYTLKQQNQNYSQALNTIVNYENLQVASVNGSVEQINTAIQKLTNGWQIAENSTKESLLRQVEYTEKMLDDTKRALENGTPGVTKASVNLAQSMYDGAVEEFEKKGGKLGEAVVGGIKHQLSNMSLPEWEKFNDFISKNKGKEVSLPGIPQHADGGAYAKGAHLTWFAEKSKEYAIPINGTMRSKNLVLNAAKDLGMLSNQGLVESNIRADLNMNETNNLLRAMLNKDRNTYLDGNKLISYTSTRRDKSDGIRTALARGGIAFE